MVERRLSADEAALWQRVMATVRPARTAPPAMAPKSLPAGQQANAKVKAEAGAASAPPKLPVSKPSSPKPAKPVAIKRPTPGVTLDGSWDRRLAGGQVVPDSSIDLHDHTLDTAYVALDRGLDQAIRRGDRVLLLITGKPPRPESERPHARGRIRAAVGDWLAASRHAGHIAAVRASHPRHGGAGALYIILRRRRDEQKY